MPSYKNVAVLGAAGALGAPVLKAIVDSGKFNVTVITRPSSKSTFDSSVKVVRADYSSVDSLTSALKGHDAVVSAVGTEGLLGQSILIDAAIAAGVKRILPSEFGSDLSNPKTAAMPVFGYKVATRKHLEAKVAAGADITYTYVVNSGFLDWGLDSTFLLDWKSAEPKLFNGGDFEFSSTTLASVGQAVVGVLDHPEETKNRTVYIQDIAISQKKLLELARKVAPEKKWNPVTVSLDDQEKWANAKVAEGDFSMPVMYTYLNVVMFQDGYGSRIEKLDNELLGVKGKTEADVEAIFKKLLAGS
ncbi:isoflavone reductase family protein-like protein CipA [Rhexocercosporidium sp. MPI-PUGE-AT-0058]|nr:isoflavone reductase family protein-like protein CipA [Rhexocercosporidium sp. MPI-PUGE-AT-0058]